MEQSLSTYAADDVVSSALGFSLPSSSARKLVTIRAIDAVEPIPEADAIEVATIGGWKVVVKKGEFKVGDSCIYFEIDSFLADGNSAWQFLVDKHPKTYNGVKGHKLRTVKLRGQISQGLVMPLAAFPIVQAAIRNDSRFSVPAELKAEYDNVLFVMHQCGGLTSIEDIDFSTLLGVVKYEPPVPAQLAGSTKGYFPSFIRKTDQERCQNLKAQIFGYDEQIVKLDMSPEQLDSETIARGRVKVVDDVVYAVHPAKADRNARYEVTIKLDGSSATFFHNNGEIGVCSRNLQLKVSDENNDNTFVKMLYSTKLNEVLPVLGNVAIQGELMGEGIQGNKEQLKGHQFFVFDIYLIDEGRFATSAERMLMLSQLAATGVNLMHVPVLHQDVTLAELGLNNVDDLLRFAEGPSLNATMREGVVFKRADGEFSFKIISNSWLLKSE